MMARQGLALFHGVTGEPKARDQGSERAVHVYVTGKCVVSSIIIKIVLAKERSVLGSD
jgi:hypothetical protein